MLWEPLNISNCGIQEAFSQFQRKGLDRFIEAMKLVIEEHFALFGIPEWKDYWTVLHLTESGRGGLEHLRSQTSMMPRKCLQEGNEEQWRDLIIQS